MNFKRALIILLLAAFIMPSIAMAQITARFLVTKTFTDSNPGEVEVTITCNTGTPLVQSAMISAGNPVAFVVEELIVIGDSDIGETTCEIVEDGETGYDAEYSNGYEDSAISCLYNYTMDNLGEENICAIENTPAPVTVAVTKVWEITDPNSVELDTDVRVLVHSEAEIIDGHECYDDADYYCLYLDFDSFIKGSQTLTFEVVPSFDGTNVYLYEDIYNSAVESSNTCGGGYDGMEGMVTVKPNQGASCTFTNTVFFEGIPTLSQYGLAIMALLMLGVGFVGFRRFV